MPWRKGQVILPLRYIQNMIDLRERQAELGDNLLHAIDEKIADHACNLARTVNRGKAEMKNFYIMAPP